MSRERRALGPDDSSAAEEELRGGWEVFSAMMLARRELTDRLDALERLRSERERVEAECDDASERTADSVREMDLLLEQLVAEDEAREAAALAAGDQAAGDGAHEAKEEEPDAGSLVRSQTRLELNAESWSASLQAAALTDGVRRMRALMAEMRRARRAVSRARLRYGSALQAYAAFLKEGAVADGELATRLAVGDSLDELERTLASAARRGRGGPPC